MKEFKKYYIIPAAPEEIYLALTNPATIQLWTGEPAEMSTEPGSEFSLWEGSITGKNIAFEENKKINRNGILVSRNHHLLLPLNYIHTNTALL